MCSATWQRSGGIVHSLYELTSIASFGDRLPVSSQQKTIKEIAVRGFFTLAVKAFYRDIRIIGEEPVNDGPLLVVATHGNGLVDPVMAALPYKRNFFFLARNTMFKGKFLQKVQDFFSVIPVFRKIEGQSIRQNLRSFERASEVLLKRKGLIMFPSSYYDPYKHFPFQRGAARIAFESEKKEDWKLGLRIQPIVIHYGHLWRGNSTVTIEITKPIEVKKFRDLYEQNAREALVQLTEEVEVQIRNRVVEFEELLENLTEEQSHFIESISELLSPVAVNDKERLELTANILRKMGREEDSQVLEEAVRQHMHRARRVGLGRYPVHNQLPGIIEALLLSPLVFFGMAVHTIPLVTGRILYSVLDAKVHPYYRGSINFLGSVGVMLTWYFLLYCTLPLLGVRFPMVCGIFVVSIISGIITRNIGHGVLCKLALELSDRYADAFSSAYEDGKGLSRILFSEALTSTTDK